MPTSSAAAGATYEDLRRRALNLRRSGASPNALQAVLMDWTSESGTATVLATADGTASIYLSNGSGFIGGSQADAALRKTALRAMQLAQIAQIAHATATPVIDTPLPLEGLIYFYLVTGNGTLQLQASEASLRAGQEPLKALAQAMQAIVTGYRSIDHQRQHPTPAAPPRPQAPLSLSAPAAPSRSALPPAPLWGKQDRFGRGVQAACGAVLLLAAIALFSFSAMESSSTSYRGGAGATAIGCLYVSVRCFWYAATGRDNMNRDDF